MRKTYVTLFGPAARTATENGADQINNTHTGAHITIDATASSATPSVVFTVQGKDPVSGKYYTILVSAAVTGVSTTVLRVFPAATPAANLTANDFIPHVWRVIATHGDADSITYTVGATLS